MGWLGPSDMSTAEMVLSLSSTYMTCYNGGAMLNPRQHWIYFSDSDHAGLEFSRMALPAGPPRPPLSDLE